MEFKRGQVTIFIIVAIILVVAIVGFFVLRGSVSVGGIPASIEPVYTSFLFCLEEEGLVGIDVLESQAGYIELPNFEPGSAYMPFSNQLDFLGNPVPYWYYVSGNNIQKEQIPSKNFMEEQLENFIEEQIVNCVFDSYYEQGFEIEQEIPKADVSIKKNKVEVELEMDFAVRFGEENVIIKNHNVEIDSKLGNLYSSAREIYDLEQEDLFLEKYGLDTLRLYAPVDGVEITCSPQIWSGDEVFDELEIAIEANTLALKENGGEYSLKNKDNEYFVTDISVDGEVRFLNSKTWPHTYEVEPSDGSILMAMPVGNQPGLGILGFCYVPYHFVYNVRYPVLVQVQEGEEIFQFPLAVLIERNNPREALEFSSLEIGVPELCEYKNTLVNVNVYDSRSVPIEADISYDCLGETCYIDKTSSGFLSKAFPQCINGYVVARAEGFEEGRELFTTMEAGSLSVFLDKLHEIQVDLNVDNRNYNGEAIITFISESGSKTVVYPEQKTIELSEGQYEVQVYIYEESSLKLEETVSEQCVEVPRSGLFGIIGLTEKKCFDIEIPEQSVSSALSGGGKQDHYILENELASSNAIEINAESLPLPRTLEQIQENFILFENKGLNVVFK